MPKRRVPIVVISDVHLGTPACRHEELLAYLRSIRPGRLILCGDIADLGGYFRQHWPKGHLSIIRRILKWAAKGIPVDYVVGNHDAALRQWLGLRLAGIRLRDRLELLDDEGRRTLVVHGDCFDAELACPRWLRVLGGWVYDALTGVGSLFNSLRGLVGLSPISLPRLAKGLAGSVSGSYVRRFESTAVARARRDGYRGIICGHIHEPACRMDDGVQYLNSGDWVEHGTALEYDGKNWSLMAWSDLARRNSATVPQPVVPAEAPIAAA
jgi:UDP-2,3-diacylglucosamine pyrophosphatase LpxH